mmetsp:Transcript_103704/g.323239  ORF Transcript_103704/g.323239 Transcript_103704/m.323239 type:complete len:463 (-) Transcript_103704:44-1432(-)
MNPTVWEVVDGPEDGLPVRRSRDPDSRLEDELLAIGSLVREIELTDDCSLHFKWISGAGGPNTGWVNIFAEDGRTHLAESDMTFAEALALERERRPAPESPRSPGDRFEDAVEEEPADGVGVAADGEVGMMFDDAIEAGRLEEALAALRAEREDSEDADAEEQPALSPRPPYQGRMGPSVIVETEHTEREERLQQRRLAMREAFRQRALKELEEKATGIKEKSTGIQELFDAARLNAREDVVEMEQAARERLVRKLLDAREAERRTLKDTEELEARRGTAKVYKSGWGDPEEEYAPLVFDWGGLFQGHVQAAWVSDDKLHVVKYGRVAVANLRGQWDGSFQHWGSLFRGDVRAAWAHEGMLYVVIGGRVAVVPLGAAGSRWNRRLEDWGPIFRGGVVLAAWVVNEKLYVLRRKGGAGRVEVAICGWGDPWDGTTEHWPRVLGSTVVTAWVDCGFIYVVKTDR